MNHDELDSMQASLGIQLPECYRAAMVNFPVPACRGNADTYLWDDPAALIQENERLRRGESYCPPWPARYFCLGRAGGGDCYALDLSSSDSRVHWVDHSQIDSFSADDDAPSFDEWLSQFVDDTRHDLEGDGIDPDGTPEERSEMEAQNARAGCWGLLILIAVGVVLVMVGGLAIDAFGCQ